MATTMQATIQHTAVQAAIQHTAVKTIAMSLSWQARELLMAKKLDASVPGVVLPICRHSRGYQK